MSRVFFSCEIKSWGQQTMSYSKLGANKGENNSLVDIENDQLNSNNMSSQPYIIPDVASTSSAPPSYTSNAPSTANLTQGGSGPTAAAATSTTSNSKSHIFQIKFYQQFFDLDTDTFFLKIFRALNPLNHSFSASSEETTELYGFFWITGTLIFLMFVSSTGSNILNSWLHGGSDEKGGESLYQYRFDLLTLLFSLFYGYNLLIPSLLYFITTWVFKFPSTLSLAELISIYGYTNILWVPITFINFVIALLVSQKNHRLLMNVLEWTIVALSGAVTGLSNISKISPLVQRNCLELATLDSLLDARKYHYAIISVLLVLHVGFTIAVKVTFFGFSN